MKVVHMQTYLYIWITINDTWKQ